MYLIWINVKPLDTRDIERVFNLTSRDSGNVVQVSPMKKQIIFQYFYY